MDNNTAKTQINSAAGHIQYAINGAKARLEAFEEKAKEYVHLTPEAQKAAGAAVNALKLHIEAAEGKLKEFLDHIV